MHLPISVLNPLRRCRNALAAVAAALLLHPAAAQTLTVSVARTPLSLPLYVAVENGYFSDEGLDVKVTDCTGGHRCMKQLLDGHSDLATAGDLPIVFNSFDRTDYAVLATITTTSDDIKILAHARSGITRPLHLAGKRVGAVAGTASQYFLELYLLTLGIDPKLVTAVHLQPEEAIPSLQAGKVDAVAIWEPFAYQGQKGLGNDAVVLPNAGAYILTFNLVSHRRLLGARDTDLTRFLRAVDRAERFIAQRPDDAKAILRTRLQVDQGFIDWVWKGMAYRLGLEQSLITTMEGEARWARRAGHVTAKASVNFLSLLYTGPLAAAKPGSVGVAR